MPVLKIKFCGNVAPCSVSTYLLMFQRIIVPSEKLADYFYYNKQIHNYVIKVYITTTVIYTFMI
jgi:hypothetical protein